ncbi:MAG: argininosuccinate lyase [Thermotaleaceae bacterium]
MDIRGIVEKEDGIKFPGKSFEKNILTPIFDVQKQYYYHPFIDITKAHVIMLIEQRIITLNEGKKILEGIETVEKENFQNRSYDPNFEDMFFMIEKRLEEIIGKDLAGKIHIARSRNDIGLCEFRMALRKMVLEVAQEIHKFREVLLMLIKEHLHTVMPAYTHTQPAQPTTLAHYLLAFYDSLYRDYCRFMRAEEEVNKSPLGAVAITTTGFNISRERTCELLGFDVLVENSYDAIAGADYLTEAASVLMIFNTNMSRFIKDTLDFCTQEFNVYYLTDPYVQTSSVMPQKRNPSSLEHCRPLIGRAIGEAKVVFDVLHNTPYGDIVDSEETLQSHIYDSMKYTIRVLEVVKNVFATLKVNKEVLDRRAHEGFITVTELADALVREKGLSFRESHHLTSRIVKYLISRNATLEEIDPKIIQTLSQEVLGHTIDLDRDMLKRALDPHHFIEIRGVVGGPAPLETQRMWKERAHILEQDKNKLSIRLNRYQEASCRIEKAIKRIRNMEIEP